MRFRQADWLHRACVFFQLIVFSALSAFTRDFDISNGLYLDEDHTERDALYRALGQDETADAAADFRNTRLPRINARGLSLVLAISRLVLLLQYCVGKHFIIPNCMFTSWDVGY